MRPHINLLQEDLFSVKNDWLDAEKAFWLVLIASTLVIVSGIVLWGHSTYLYWHVSQLQNQEQLLKSRWKQLTAVFPKSEEDPALLERLEGLEKEIKSKKQVLELLSGQRIGNRQGFSAQFTQLARGEWSDIWLTQVQLLDGGRQIVLVGRTLQAKEILDVVRRLSEEGAFKGIQFPYFQVGMLPTAGDHLQQTRFAFATRLELLQRAWKGDLSKAEKEEVEKKEGLKGILLGK
ncbi:MAG: hypothetical protein HQM06_00340 [Magnetococcales bacterium]|nr:hypothetical protein [Magnetococcales bacterium]